MTISLVESGRKVESSIDFTPFLRALKKHWLKVTLVTVIVTGISVPLVAQMTSKFVSTATVMIKAQQDNATPLKQIDGYDSTRDPYYETQYNLMQSRVVLVKAITSLKLQEDEAFNGDEKNDESQWTLSEETRIENALKTLRKNLSFTLILRTQLVYVSYESASSERAAEIANGVAQAFVDYTIEQKITKTKAAQEWNALQMEELKAQVDAKKKEMADYLNQQGLLTFRGIDGFETENLGITTNKYADAKERRLAAQADYETMLKIANGPIENLASLPEISGHAQLQDLRIALIQAQRSLSDLSRRYGPKHNKIQEAQAQIDAIKKQTYLLLNELKQGLQKKYQAALIKEQRYKALLDNQATDYKALVAKRDHYNDLKTELDKTEDLYKELFLRTKEQSLTSTYRESDAVIYDPAVVAEKPQKPNKALLIAMVCVMTFILSVLAVIVMAALDRRITHLGQLRGRLGLDSAGDLPKFETQGDWLRRISENPASAEIVHGINAAIHLDAAPQMKVLGVTSCFTDEGASSLCRLLADAMSDKKRTLLVDLDYRASHQMVFASAKENQQQGGFSALVNQLGKEQIVGVRQNLDVVARGELDESPLVFFDRDEFTACIDQLSQQYDQLILNLPALEESKDTLLVSRVLDVLVVVVKANQHQSPELTRELSKLTMSAEQSVFGVLNQVNDDDLQSEESKAFVAQGSSLALDTLEQA
ncbi:GumC family protein [Vibrio proteolyticus]